MTTNEKDFLDNYSLNDYPNQGITVDVLIFTLREGRLSLLLVERDDHPFKGAWALPGGFVQPAETADAAAHRELVEETGLTGIRLEQLKTYSGLDRDPRGRVISIAYCAIVPSADNPRAGTDARNARFVALEELALEDGPGVALAFDHATIISDGLERIRSKFEYSPLALEFLKDSFTLTELRAVYEAVWGTTINASTFHRKVLSTPSFVELSATTERQYHAGKATLLHPALLRVGLDNGLHDTVLENGIVVSA